MEDYTGAGKDLQVSNLLKFLVDYESVRWNRCVKLQAIRFGSRYGSDRLKTPSYSTP